MSEKRLELRVVSGIYRRRKLLAPNSKDVRPTKDRIREAIFSALGNIEGFSFLDLYAGSGAMGIEALSRGASYAAFVDINKESIDCIKDNLLSLNIKEGYNIYRDLDTNVLKQFQENKRSFDIVFLDPPYKKGKYEDIIRFIISNELINKGGIIVCESGHPINIDESQFSKCKTYKYGEINIYILWR